MMDTHFSLFTNVVIKAGFHPQARAVYFWHQPHQMQCASKVMLKTRSLAPEEWLQADIAEIASDLGAVASDDFCAFCADLEAIFAGAVPHGPLVDISQSNKIKVQRLSQYAQFWQHKNPQEVSKLLSFVMALPIYSGRVSALIFKNQRQPLLDILQLLERPGADYLIGVDSFKRLFCEEMNQAVVEAKLLVSTYRGTAQGGKAHIVNTMLNKMIKH